MPIYEYQYDDGTVVERIYPYPPPDSIVEGGEVAKRIPSAAAFKVEDGTELFFKATGQRPVEPGVKEDVKRNKQYKEEREDRERRETLDKIFPEVLAETGASLPD